ncbi:hypothetical protein ACJRO7_022252 [Eucalyptus globulus]|uniref:Aconitase/3-isopropylmalate dehydratase large subunit alpha/beta/alpha domain-containing protein n=1 Tax=Eucalyptus globulus TaxID=34317 RepID=A0ABD3KP07_EUCGL
MRLYFAQLRHGDVVIAAITSCTNTSDPSVMLGAALVARKACELGLEVKPWIKTSLAPGSGVVTKYLQKSGLQTYLNQLGFHIVGYGCTTCIGNSGDIDESVASAITENDLVAAAVFSGNKNFEGRVHPLTRANYLASPPLVVAYALERGVDRRDFNSYGSRRGNDEIMARGTFANIRLVNKFLKGEVGPKTIHIPSGEKLSVYDVAMRYKSEGHAAIILAGAEYVSGSSRDWAAKGPMLLGTKTVIAKSFEQIHRSNLLGMGIIPLCFKSGEDAETLN